MFQGFSQVIGYWNDIEIAPTGIQPISPWNRTLSATGRKYLAGTTTPVLEPVSTAEIVAIKPMAPDSHLPDSAMSELITHLQFNNLMYFLLFFLN